MGVCIHILSTVYALPICMPHIHDMNVCVRYDDCLGECVVVVRVACC